MIATMEKKLRAAVAANDEAAALDLLNKQFSVLDKAVKGGTFHKNKADRKKSRMALLVKGMKKAEAAS
jgi:ribosomal protein S20